ncbi:MAG TPA: hypothetical protein PKE58_20840 [Acidobacteriota bacterium]|nr:hypothetical protein [Acidobacteriota bacterium]
MKSPGPSRLIPSPDLSILNFVSFTTTLFRYSPFFAPFTLYAELA